MLDLLDENDYAIRETIEGEINNIQWIDEQYENKHRYNYNQGGYATEVGIVVEFNKKFFTEQLQKRIAQKEKNNSLAIFMYDMLQSENIEICKLETYVAGYRNIGTRVTADITTFGKKYLSIKQELLEKMTEILEEVVEGFIEDLEMKIIDLIEKQVDYVESEEYLTEMALLS